MATTHRRRRGKSLNLDLANSSIDDKPPLSALFLVQFDVKAGYTLAWKQSQPGLDLQNSVEFKSLPSGLHNVKEDLIYFMHGDDHAGISAFVNRSTEQYERNALMLAVGALVSLEQGRLGRSWKHAADLKRIAQELSEDPTKTEKLDEYWHSHQTASGGGGGDDQHEETPSKSNARRPSLVSTGSRGTRSRSGSTYTAPGSGLSPHHPARSISSLLDTFGPLIFPLYKAAILRQRILLITEAPVELACNFVYDLSIISNIPSSTSELVPLEPLPTRLQPLFSVGVHDIDDLSKRGTYRDAPSDDPGSDDPGYGWIACTTDDVLGMKSNLYDLSIKMPQHHTKNAQNKAWPVVKTSAGEEIKASQRDSRRYRVMRRAQKRALTASRGTSPAPDNSAQAPYDAENDGEEDEEPLLKQNILDSFDDSSSVADDELIEPMSWSALAYNSFMWWASAGEKRADLEEEAEHDASMFRNLNTYSDQPASASSRSRSSSNPLTPGAMISAGPTMPPEMTIIAYFHKFTTVMIERLAELVDAADSSSAQDADGEEADVKDDADKGTVFVGSDDIRHMGLDVWSASDRRFVEEMVEFYFGRTAEVQGGHVECCGVRIV